MNYLKNLLWIFQQKKTNTPPDCEVAFNEENSSWYLEHNELEFNSRRTYAHIIISHTHWDFEVYFYDF